VQRKCVAIFVLHINYQYAPSFSFVNLKSASLLFSSNQQSVKLLTKYFLHSAPSFISSYPIPVFSSFPHFFFILHSLSLSPAAPEFPLSYTSHVVSTFLDSFSSFLLACVFVPFTQLYIHPSYFCSQTFPFFAYPFLW
jgi:hypothetical protein